MKNRGPLILISLTWRPQTDSTTQLIYWSELSAEISTRHNRFRAFRSSHTYLHIAKVFSFLGHFGKFMWGYITKKNVLLVYRALLYRGYFNASTTLCPEGSVGRCYMVPLGLSNDRLERQSAVETIFLLHLDCQQIKFRTSPFKMSCSTQQNALTG